MNHHVVDNRGDYRSPWSFFEGSPPVRASPVADPVPAAPTRVALRRPAGRDRAPVSLKMDRKSLMALSFAPIIAMGWAGGSLDASVRALILGWADDMGLRPSDLAYQLLEEWMRDDPGEALLALWMHDYVPALSLILDRPAKRELRGILLGRAQIVSQTSAMLVSGGRALLPAEQCTLDTIDAALS
jgi:hypothetical protein